MKTLGNITAALLTTLTLGAAVLAVRSLPDIRRYLKMRQM
ncbi:MAG: hypothetical protein QOI06_3291 [Nocardioidaceae bacterium]|jgi:hypothetical protein|nr:hypothetical protein [Nocardioidaceae bacterium]